MSTRNDSADNPIAKVSFFQHGQFCVKMTSNRNEYKAEAFAYTE